MDVNLERKKGVNGYVWYYEDEYLITSMQSWCRFCNQERHFNVISTSQLPSTSGKCWFEDLVLKIIIDFQSMLPKDTLLHCTPGSQLELTNIKGAKSQLCHITRASTVGKEYIVPIQIHDPNLIFQTTSISSSAEDLPTVSADRNMEQRLEDATGWVKHCEQEHRECWSDSGDPPLLPTRVIDLRTAFTAAGKVMLVDGDSSRANYVALSYCWGGRSPLMTVVDNVHRLKAGIAVEELPQTAQDAILVCRFLGIQYLWIDSLCIIQDDPHDWMFEAQRMCSVYENAWITIAATGSENCDIGFLRPHQAGRLRKYSIPQSAIQDPKGPHGEILAVQAHASNFAHEPLHHRAWCFQEWMLSKRILSFRREEIQYVCLEDARCDCHFPGRASGSTGIMRQFQSTIKRGDKKEMHRLWLSMVRDYTERRLTNSSDRLPAIAGLVAKFQSKSLGETYLYGLWTSDFLSGLTWNSSLTPKSGHKPNGGYPSWTWASIEGGVHFQCLRFKERLRDDAVPLTAYCTSEISVGNTIQIQYIQLLGELVPVQLRYDPRTCQGSLDPIYTDQRSTTAPKPRTFVPLMADCSLEMQLRLNEDQSQNPPSGEHTTVRRSRWRDNPSEPFECRVYCLRLITGTWGADNDEKSLALVLTADGELEVPPASFVFPGDGTPGFSDPSLSKLGKVQVFRRIGFTNTWKDGHKVWQGVEKQRVFIA